MKVAIKTAKFHNATQQAKKTIESFDSTGLKVKDSTDDALRVINEIRRRIGLKPVKLDIMETLDKFDPFQYRIDEQVALLARKLEIFCIEDDQDYDSMERAIRVWLNAANKQYKALFKQRLYVALR